MTTRLGIYIGGGANGAHLWLRMDETNGEIIGRGETSDLRALCQPSPLEPCDILLRGDLVGCRWATMPDMSAATALVAAPAMIEEDVAVDVDTLHCVAMPADATGKRLLGWIDEALIADTLAEMHAAGLQPERMAADYCGLPSPLGHRRCAALGDLILIAGDDAAPLAIQADLLPRIASSCGLADVDCHGISQVDASDLLAGYMRNDSALSLNLLQGRYRPRYAMAGDASAWWRVAVAAGLAAITATAWCVADGIAANRERDAALAQMEQTYHELFPGQRIVNAPVQLRNALQSSQAESGNFDYFALASRVYRATHEVTGAGIDTLRFDAVNGAVKITFAAADFGQLESLRGQLARQRLDVTDSGARETANGVAGEWELRVR
ncbi:MAG: hypothetical protein H6978_09360 [Gammaproteobacteria bacterium]|nr:hypothetical protein [Gammaproteobacteria bacterium]